MPIFFFLAKGIVKVLLKLNHGIVVISILSLCMLRPKNFSFSFEIPRMLFTPCMKSFKHLLGLTQPIRGSWELEKGPNTRDGFFITLRCFPLTLMFLASLDFEIFLEFT